MEVRKVWAANCDTDGNAESLPFLFLASEDAEHLAATFDTRRNPRTYPVAVVPWDVWEHIEQALKNVRCGTWKDLVDPLSAAWRILNEKESGDED